jgi:membrane protease YdiL (CAAX protease family)
MRSTRDFPAPRYTPSFHDAPTFILNGWAPALSTPAAPRWGPTATLVWTAVLLTLFYMLQIFFFGIILGASTPPGRTPGESEIARLASNGDFIAAAIFVVDPVCLLALLGLVKARPGATFADSLAVVPPPAGWMRTWIPLLIVFAMASDMLTWMLGKPIVPEFMQVAWGTAEKVSLTIAVAAVAPVTEELIFRGFLISGLRPTRLGASGAVLVSSFVWAAIHGQYGLYEMATIFALGVLLGTARVKTGSVLVPIALHAFSNVISTVETMVQASS